MAQDWRPPEPRYKLDAPVQTSVIPTREWEADTGITVAWHTHTSRETVSSKVRR